MQIIVLFETVRPAAQPHCVPSVFGESPCPLYDSFPLYDSWEYLSGLNRTGCGTEGCQRAKAPEAAMPASKLAAFVALLQKAQADAPAVIGEIISILEMFSGQQNGAAGFGANGAILTALGNLLQKAVASLPTLLPEIASLIALFGGTVNVQPATAS